MVDWRVNGPCVHTSMTSIMTLALGMSTGAPIRASQQRLPDGDALDRALMVRDDHIVPGFERISQPQEHAREAVPERGSQEHPCGALKPRQLRCHPVMVMSGRRPFRPLRMQVVTVLLGVPSRDATSW